MPKTVQPTEDSDFRRKREGTQALDINIDEEIKKIISESLVKAKGSSKGGTVINPLSDVKKKEFGKLKDSPNKLKLITKHSDKITVKEIDKNTFNLILEK